MVYNNNLIVVVKSKGKVLREFQGNIVRLPFGSDYSILVINKDKNRKALVNIKIDGKDVLDGNGLIVDADSTSELKGFMKGSKVKNKFRFIEKTDRISNFRGNHPEDGLVEVDYRFEEYHYTPSFLNYLTSDPTITYRSKSFSGENIMTSCSVNETYKSFTDVNDSGITVPGKVTRQDFIVGSIGSLESISYNLILHLKGRTEKGYKKVNKPVTVKSKIQCQTCGKKWNSSMNYCGTCSTYLH